MNLIIISNAALWIVIICLAFIIYALTRQIGVLYERVAPAGALAINQTIEVGQSSPNLALQSISSGLIEIGAGKNTGKSQLIFFISPDCPVCKTLMPAIKSSAQSESDWVELIFASDGQEQNHQGYIQQHSIESYPYIISEILGKSFGIAKLPYAVLINNEGTISAMGIINSREHIDSLFEAKDLKTASIQEYMANQTHLAKRV